MLGTAAFPRISCGLLFTAGIPMLAVHNTWMREIADGVFDIPIVYVHAYVVRRRAELDFTVAVLGHGPAVTGRAADKFRELAAR